MAYAFNDRAVASELKRMAEASLSNTATEVKSNDLSSIYVQAPAAGIPARVGTDCGSETCKQFAIDGNGSVSALDLDVVVWNTDLALVAANSYIMCQRIGNKWIRILGASAGAGQHILQLTTSTAITAAVGLTAGTGSAIPLALLASAWATDGTAVTIFNPYEYSVPTDSMITAYSDTDDPTRYVLVQAECATA
tara:strand:+ start:214 stop:795 length:582 start_codon:yes stop_codon:yes gene_type:complete